MKEFLKGDSVIVRGKVVYEFPGDDHDYDEKTVAIRIDGHYSNLYIKPDDLTFVHHQFEVDDRVWSDGGHGIVRGILDDHAWVQMEDGFFMTSDLSDLEHAPEMPSEPPAAIDDTP
jgi:hypothetical protein